MGISSSPPSSFRSTHEELSLSSSWWDISRKEKRIMGRGSPWWSISLHSYCPFSWTPPIPLSGPLYCPTPSQRFPSSCVRRAMMWKSFLSRDRSKHSLEPFQKHESCPRPPQSSFDERKFHSYLSQELFYYRKFSFQFLDHQDILGRWVPVKPPIDCLIVPLGIVAIASKHHSFSPLVCFNPGCNFSIQAKQTAIRKNSIITWSIVTR